jgi:hypothetical protein
MRVVQALHWLQDLIVAGQANDATGRLGDLLSDTDRGHILRDDLREGLPTLPIWMQSYLRDLLDDADPVLPLPLDRPTKRPARDTSRRQARGHV